MEAEVKAEEKSQYAGEEFPDRDYMLRLKDEEQETQAKTANLQQEYLRVRTADSSRLLPCKRRLAS